MILSTMAEWVRLQGVSQPTWTTTMQSEQGSAPEQCGLLAEQIGIYDAIKSKIALRARLSLCKGAGACQSLELRPRGISGATIARL